MAMGSDRGTFGRLASTTLVVAAIAFFGLATYFPWIVPINLALGTAIGLVSLGALHWMVHGLTASDPGRGRQALWVVGMLHVGKYGLIGLALYLLFAGGYAHAPALAAGFTLPTAVLCLKEAGRRLNLRLGVEGRKSTETEETVRGSPGVGN
jgi:hypothetical protein